MTKKVKAIEKKFTSSFSSLKKFDAFFKRLKKALKLDESDFDRLYIAVNEAFVNAIVHGNQLNPKKKVLVRIKPHKTALSVEVVDEGKGFSPEKVPDPTQPENILKESGRGIFIMKKFADRVKISSTSRGTKVVLSIKIKKRPGV